jgi:hypothetical protein
MSGEALGAIVLLFALVMFVLFAIVLPYWTYRDAQKRGIDSPALWGLLVFFGGLIGLVLYLILGRDG